MLCMARIWVLQLFLYKGVLGTGYWVLVRLEMEMVEGEGGRVMSPT